MNFLKKIIDVEVEEKFFKRIVFIGILVIIAAVLIVFLDLGLIKKYEIPKGMKTKNNGTVEYRVY